ncbi:MAG: zinc-binding dehydrogenase [Caldilineaceae bacterium]|nr:zinc-binding dehydrogenase [Caldilineaceae bacterium]HRJ41363.1 zinc-binding dehydrogenase [Caldilineaceae bacterium]
MRAILFRQHSPSPTVYEYSTDAPKPEPGAGEVLVRVRYAALNRLDDFVRRGWKGLHLEWPHIPCADFSGTIAALGAGVVGWDVGQRVVANPLLWCGECRQCLRGFQNRCERGGILGEHARGACAEFVAVPARNLLAIPESYPMRQAAAAPLVYQTAWHNLMVAGGLRAGERVLVVGAGGGVNSVSIQIAKLAGAQVYAIASTAEKARLAQALGADWVHDRRADPAWSRAVYRATDKQGVDVVVDNVGQATWPDSLRALAPGGRLLTVGGSSGYEATVPVALIFGRHLQIIGSTMGSQDDFREVMGLVFAGKLSPVVDSVHPLADYPKALARMLANEHFGKILVDIEE